MLIITRRKGEKLLIGDTIEITVLDSMRSMVRFGIDADPEIPVHREEIYYRIMEEKAVHND